MSALAGGTHAPAGTYTYVCPRVAACACAASMCTCALQVESLRIARAVSNGVLFGRTQIVRAGTLPELSFVLARLF
eukprot:6179293-Pleurochrysis_carterae.AAC.3